MFGVPISSRLEEKAVLTAMEAVGVMAVIVHVMMMIKMTLR